MPCLDVRGKEERGWGSEVAVAVTGESQTGLTFGDLGNHGLASGLLKLVAHVELTPRVEPGSLAFRSTRYKNQFRLEDVTEVDYSGMTSQNIFVLTH